MACLPFTAIFIAVSLLSLLPSCSYGVSPSISHANEPFTLPHHFPTCIYTAFTDFIQTLPDSSSYKVGARMEKEAAACGGNGGNGTVILLRLRLLDSKQNESREERGEAMKRSYGRLLEEFRRTLKLRYKWAVIMSGQYWMEYASKKKGGAVAMEGAGAPSIAAAQKGGAAAEAAAMEGAGAPHVSAVRRRKSHDRKEGAGKDAGMRLLGGDEVDGIDCLPRGDILVSHSNNGAGADNGFDILMSPHSIVAQNNGFYLMMQGDCNLVLYSAAGFPLWSSRTKGRGSRCSLSLLRDGNLVISNQNNTRIWASGSSIACPSVFLLMMQNDGNLVIYDMLSGLPIWATGSNQ